MGGILNWKGKYFFKNKPTQLKLKYHSDEEGGVLRMYVWWWHLSLGWKQIFNFNQRKTAFPLPVLICSFIRSSKAQIISRANWNLVGCVKWRKEVVKSEGSFTFSCIVLDIIMWCFYMENIPGPFQSPRCCSSGKAARALENQQQSKGSLAAVEGINWGGAWPVR